MENLKPKKEHALLEWFEKAVRSGRNQMTVPPHIVKLSCGCERKADDKPFAIVQSYDGYWGHCGKSLKDLPKTEWHPQWSFSKR